MSVKEEANVVGEEAVANMSLMDIIEGENDRGIPTAKFVDDLGAFAESFSPPASAELLIGAYTELHTKYKSFEITLTQKRKLRLLWHWWRETVSLTFFFAPPRFVQRLFSGQHLQQKVPELGKSLTLVRSLLKKKEEGEVGMARYSLADNIYAKAELDYSEGVVNLWLGANVMLEYTYEEAIEFLSKNEDKARELRMSRQIWLLFGTDCNLEVNGSHLQLELKKDQQRILA
jgi:hypothetical protein